MVAFVEMGGLYRRNDTGLTVLGSDFALAPFLPRVVAGDLCTVSFRGMGLEIYLDNVP
jgi:hypothetical protein